MSTGVKPVSTEQIAVAIFRLHRDGGAAWPMDACREEAERIVYYLTHDEAGRPVRWDDSE